MNIKYHPGKLLEGKLWAAGSETMKSDYKKKKKMVVYRGKIKCKTMKSKSKFKTGRADENSDTRGCKGIK